MESTIESYKEITECLVSLLSTFFTTTLAVLFNPFLVIVPILYLLKTPVNLWFSGVFRGYKKGTLARNGLIGKCYEKIIFYSPAETLDSPSEINSRLVWCFNITYENGESTLVLTHRFYTP